MTLSYDSITSRDHLGFFRFHKLKNDYLLTNDVGRFCILSSREFTDLVDGRLDGLAPLTRSRLSASGFLAKELDLDAHVRQFASRNRFLSSGTSLHIIVITLRCDHRCLYCQTSSGTDKDKALDMDEVTAKMVVDRIFESPSRAITIEFQGGEPTLNFPVLRLIVDYASKKNITAKKALFFSLVSNLAQMTTEEFDFVVSRKIGICTSLDGPANLQNKQRIFFYGRSGSYKKTTAWLKKFKQSFKTNVFPHRINALATITKYSLPHAEKIVDQYLGLGLNVIHLRPASPFGLAKTAWKKIGFSAEQFLSFYRKAVDHMLKINHAGKKCIEKTAALFLAKILTDVDPNFLDLRSPCGAGIGQLAYHYNGDVYTCDEGRMLGQSGDEAFKIGNVKTLTYAQLMESPIVKSLCVASCLSNLPGCQSCAYLPYCGVCPIYNYSTCRNIFGKEPHNDRCKINKGILDYLFEKLRDEDDAKILKTWLHSE